MSQTSSRKARITNLIIVMIINTIVWGIYFLAAASQDTAVSVIGFQAGYLISVATLIWYAVQLRGRGKDGGG